MSTPTSNTMDPSKPRTVKAWCSNKPGAPFELSQVTLPPLGEDEVEVKITHCGMCATDVDAVDGKYGAFSTYPCCPGHEGVGIVTARGGAVPNTPIGLRVGIGTMRDSCGCCIYCSNGQNNLCTQTKWTYLGQDVQAGGFSSYVRIKAVFAIPIPDNIDSADAGPLMCAGTTVFAPFRNHNIKSGESVGVVGIGGLGALAIQLGRAHGCEMTALSSSNAKKDMCIQQLGAHRYVDMTNQQQIKDNTGRLHYILVTAPTASLDWATLLSLLAKGGKLILLGVVHSDIPVNVMKLVWSQLTVCGSAVGSVGLTLDMLRLVSVHGIKPMIEIFPFSQVNQAITKLKNNQLRFRAVLVHPHDTYNT